MRRRAQGCVLLDAASAAGGSGGGGGGGGRALEAKRTARVKETECDLWESVGEGEGGEEDEGGWPLPPVPAPPRRHRRPRGDDAKGAALCLGGDSAAEPNRGVGVADKAPCPSHDHPSSLRSRRAHARHRTFTLARAPSSKAPGPGLIKFPPPPPTCGPVEGVHRRPLSVPAHFRLRSRWWRLSHLANGVGSLVAEGGAAASRGTPSARCQLEWLTRLVRRVWTQVDRNVHPGGRLRAVMTQLAHVAEWYLRALPPAPGARDDLPPPSPGPSRPTTQPDEYRRSWRGTPSDPSPSPPPSRPSPLTSPSPPTRANCGEEWGRSRSRVHRPESNPRLFLIQRHLVAMEERRERLRQRKLEPLSSRCPRRASSALPVLLAGATEVELDPEPAPTPTHRTAKVSSSCAHLPRSSTPTAAAPSAPAHAPAPGPTTRLRRKPAGLARASGDAGGTSLQASQEAAAAQSLSQPADETKHRTGDEADHKVIKALLVISSDCTTDEIDLSKNPPKAHLLFRSRDHSELFSRLKLKVATNSSNPLLSSQIEPKDLPLSALAAAGVVLDSLDTTCELPCLASICDDDMREKGLKFHVSDLGYLLIPFNTGVLDDSLTKECGSCTENLTGVVSASMATSTIDGNQNPSRAFHDTAASVNKDSGNTEEHRKLAGECQQQSHQGRNEEIRQRNSEEVKQGNNKEIQQTVIKDVEQGNNENKSRSNSKDGGVGVVKQVSSTSSTPDDSVLYPVRCTRTPDPSNYTLIKRSCFRSQTPSSPENDLSINRHSFSLTHSPVICHRTSVSTSTAETYASGCNFSRDNLNDQRSSLTGVKGSRIGDTQLSSQPVYADVMKVADTTNFGEDFRSRMVYTPARNSADRQTFTEAAPRNESTTISEKFFFLESLRRNVSRLGVRGPAEEMKKPCTCFSRSMKRDFCDSECITKSDNIPLLNRDNVFKSDEKNSKKLNIFRQSSTHLLPHVDKETPRNSRSLQNVNEEICKPKTTPAKDSNYCELHTLDRRQCGLQSDKTVDMKRSIAFPSTDYRSIKLSVPPLSNCDDKSNDEFGECLNSSRLRVDQNLPNSRSASDYLSALYSYYKTPLRTPSFTYRIPHFDSQDNVSHCSKALSSSDSDTSCKTSYNSPPVSRKCRSHFDKLSSLVGLRVMGINSLPDQTPRGRSDNSLFQKVSVHDSNEIDMLPRQRRHSESRISSRTRLANSNSANTLPFAVESSLTVIERPSLKKSPRIRSTERASENKYSVDVNSHLTSSIEHLLGKRGLLDRDSKFRGDEQSRSNEMCSRVKDTHVDFECSVSSNLFFNIERDFRKYDINPSYHWDISPSDPPSFPEKRQPTKDNKTEISCSCTSPTLLQECKTSIHQEENQQSQSKNLHTRARTTTSKIPRLISKRTSVSSMCDQSRPTVKTTKPLSQRGTRDTITTTRNLRVSSEGSNNNTSSCNKPKERTVPVKNPKTPERNLSKPLSKPWVGATRYGEAPKREPKCSPPKQLQAAGGSRENGKVSATKSLATVPKGGRTPNPKAGRPDSAPVRRQPISGNRQLSELVTCLRGHRQLMERAGGGSDANDESGSASPQPESAVSYRDYINSLREHLEFVRRIYPRDFPPSTFPIAICA